MNLNKTVFRQRDQSDCGIACLATISKFHGGEIDLEQLRHLSGTSKQGTTMLGLMQAARAMGFSAEGLEADSVDSLQQLAQPAILHTTENNINHYLVFFNYDKHSKESLLNLGDPNKGLIQMSPENLDKIWRSKALLKLIPTEKFEQSKEKHSKKNQWIISLIEKDYPLLTASLFLGIIISILGISTAIFSQKLIDDILPKHDTEKLTVSLILVTVLLSARSFLGYIRGFLTIQQSQKFNIRIVQNFYSSLLGLPKSFFDTRKTGDLIARMNDTRRIQSALSTISGSIVIDALIIICSILFVFSYSILIGIVLISGLPIYFSILFYFNKPIANAQRETMVGYALTESNFIDTIQGIADIKLLSKQKFFEQKNEAMYGSFQKNLFSLGSLNIKFFLASELIGVFFMISIFRLTSWLEISKELKIGEMIALLSLAGSIMPSLNRLVISNIQIQEALIAFNRMYEFSSIEKEKNLTNGKELSVLENLVLKNLSFRFPGRPQILKNVTLDLNKGELVTLLGESGQGKSTLLQLLQKFYSPESGSIYADKFDLRHLNTSIWRSQIGSVPQDPKIFNGNLIYNITLSENEQDYKNAIAYCEETGFSKYFNQLPQGYLTLVGEEGVNVSGGQKQLIALARILFRKPNLLILDEATSSMDKNTESFILDLLQKEKNNRITLFVTHRIKTAQLCDKIAILEGGTIVNLGSPEELLKSKNLFSDSYSEMIHFNK